MLPMPSIILQHTEGGKDLIPPIEKKKLTKSLLVERDKASGGGAGVSAAFAAATSGGAATAPGSPTRTGSYRGGVMPAGMSVPAWQVSNPHRRPKPSTDPHLHSHPKTNSPSTLLAQAEHALAARGVNHELCHPTDDVTLHRPSMLSHRRSKHQTVQGCWFRCPLCKSSVW
jgi:hypothetical protein